MPEAVPTDPMLGEVTRDGDVVVLRYRRRFGHPPETVWRAITESEHLRHWFPADIIGDRTEGAELVLTFWPETVEHSTAEIEEAGIEAHDPSVRGRVLVWDPQRTFAFTWGTEEVRLDLVADGTGTALVLTVRTDTPAPRGFASTASGYQLCVDALVDHLEGGPRANPSATVTPERVAGLEAAYRDRIPPV